MRTPSPSALLLWSCLVPCLAACGGEPPAPGSERGRLELARVLMGAPARVVLYAEDAAAGRAAGEAALEEIARLDGVLSDYDPASELMRLCARAGGEPVPVGRDLWDALGLALDLARQTRGAFDPTVGPLVGLWREAHETRRVPEPTRLEAARALVGWERVELHPPTRAVRLPAKGMRLDLGGVGKGFAAQAAWALLGARGFARCLVDLGGDIVVGEAPPGASGWRVKVEGGPTLLLANASVATSGDTQRFVDIDGTRYSHIVDPRTGLGLTHSAQVTVITALAARADAYATGLSVLGPAEGVRVIEPLPGVEARFVDADGTVHETEGFRRYLAP